jgi:hypothetical protein
MRAALICRQMGWTLDEYDRQPAEFIDNVFAMINEENSERNKKMKMDDN